ncbi:MULTISPECIES: cation-translocating P-type ATPase [unclassified Enterococcus]|uniref:heavy metal translocating P-type ATPase n=1 Tax=unclassified Enterococcus TaxID=2608891 RepID=UPI0015553072|nr:MULTISPECIES: cation-translocating P-type ATPase [unclassified Enterococcus]MBS7576884.1 cation-translocating P-type ATPase [Enterococcus sp. MMGLQ5-2]MBS7584291.1 cation-translocating P-type ATPase [Enterococcus sp. MMGLQ5-1]NPD12147.1 cation-translocating P-type ATPase [Enterococcus sp. MMGLQ5-1]NPD36719.1 cation-translocating P-type ATPase [Enterococcus sp. MMGLQ5-2]
MLKYFNKQKNVCDDDCCQSKVEESCSCSECQSLTRAENNNDNQANCCVEENTEKPNTNDDCCGDDGDGTSYRLKQGKKITEHTAYHYQIAGMDCGACAMTIQKAVSTIVGVNQATVNFSTGKMRVTTDSKHIARNEVLKRVKQLGYSATLADELNQQDPADNYLSQDKIVIISTIIFVVALVCKMLLQQAILANFFFSITIIFTGFKTFSSAWYAIKAKSLDMNVLMASAAIGALLIGEFSEGATVLYLFTIGIYLQVKAVDRTRQSIAEMMSLAPDLALVMKNGQWVEQVVAEISVGSRILVRSGDKIALDGVITKGATEINQASITGESIPISKTVGDSVYAGSLNETGTIEIVVNKPASESTIARVISMVEAAEEHRAPSEAFIEKFARIYTPIVFLLAIVTMLVSPLIMNIEIHESIFRGLELLIVACPCALVIATPVSIVSAIGNAAKNGILIKGGTFIEVAAKISIIAFDKTGTITNGTPEVLAVKPLTGNLETILSIASSLEKNSNHPIAKAIVAYAKANDVTGFEVTNEKNRIGKGVEGIIRGELFTVGSAKLFSLTNEQLSLKQKYESEGNTVIFIGKSNEVMGFLLVSDTIREASVKALARLKAIGIKHLVMLTGDNYNVAESIASDAGITDFFAEMMPEDKAKQIQLLRNENLVAMIGDGINDAPALAMSDLGIAMGGIGTDMAMETADIILMADNLNKLPFVFKLSRSTVRVIKQNIVASLLIKLIALIAIFAGVLPIWLAVLSDTGMAVAVTLNALRLLMKKDTN